MTERKASKAVDVISGKVNYVWQDTPERFAISVGAAKVRISGKGQCPFKVGQQVNNLKYITNNLGYR